MQNVEIREKAAKNNVYLWRIADKIGITDCHFSRRLRHEFPQEEKEKILAIIDELAKEAS
jgi:hypothetical protein